MALSEHAQTAATIRKELKKHGVKGRVTCKSYSGGSSVTVSLPGVAPWIAEKVSQFANQFRYGHFNGMEDIYEHSNTNNDLPQVKFVFVNNNFTQEQIDQARQEVEGMLQLDRFSEYDIQREVYSYMNGSSQLGCFFKKPLIKLSNNAA